MLYFKLTFKDVKIKDDVLTKEKTQSQLCFSV